MQDDATRTPPAIDKEFEFLPNDVPIGKHEALVEWRAFSEICPDGIFLNDFEQGEIGPDLFRKACEFGFEGLVSKHRDRPYRGGRQKYWIKVKNRKHPAMSRVMDALAATAQ